MAMNKNDIYFFLHQFHLLTIFDLFYERILDLDILTFHLGDMYNQMTTWDVYKSEVESGYLRWGVVHATKFFQQNVKLFEGSDGKFGLIKVRLYLNITTHFKFCLFEFFTHIFVLI